MTNNNSKTEVVKAAVSDSEILALLDLTGLKPANISPLAQLNGKASSSEALRNLKASGLVDAANNPAQACREALAILANPAAEIDLLWGNPDGISLSKAYAAAGQERLVSFTSINGSSNISYFLTSQDITDLLVQRLVFSEIKDIAPLNLDVPPAAMPVFFAILDIYRELQLRSALERRQENPVIITTEEVNRIVQEAKMELNLNWYSPVAFNAMPLDSATTESTIDEGLRILKNEGIIGVGGEPGESLSAFAHRAFPLAGFFGIKVLTAGAGTIEKTQMALFRGLSTLLLVQISPEGNDTHILVSSIATSDLPQLLFNLGTRPFEVTTPPAPPAANTIICGKCNTVNNSTAKFCSKCGASLTASGPKFCPKCGDPVKANEKFCDKCGAPLK